jgi:ABC-type antimicrobial peptide transport system permease subunit
MGTKLKLRLRIMILALRKSGFRSLLALGAVGLGIAAMMIMLALRTGAERELQAIADKTGKNLFLVKSGQVRAQPGRGSGWFRSTRLDRTDIAVLRQEIPAIHTIVPILEGGQQAKYENRNVVTTVRGVTPEFLEVRNFQVEEGRFLDGKDGLAKSRVAVVGSFVAKRLNEGFSLVGQTIWVAGTPFEVVGQLREKGIAGGQNEDDQILIPLETAERRLFNVDYLSVLLVQVARQDQITPVQEEVREALRATHRLGEGVKDDFEILSLVQARAAGKVNAAFLAGLSQIFAVITLTLGGAGVLGVSYLNVKDRTSEIGLRMAIGARRRDITSLFLAEACLLSVLGGLIGLLIGLAGIAVLRPVTGWQMAVDLRGVAVPFCVSVLIGLASGVAPAMTASRLMPVDALRDA